MSDNAQQPQQNNQPAFDIIRSISASFLPAVG